MFNDSKYTRWYFSIICNPDTVSYTEKHHIIPKSIGGSDEESNIIAVSLRQHYVLHLLLPKMVKNKTHKNKMLFALRCMLNFNKLSRRYKPSSRIIEHLKKAIRETPISSHHSDNIRKGQLGKTLSQEHKTAISKGLLGKKHTVETLEKMSRAQKRRILSPDHKNKISQTRKGKGLSSEHKNKISTSLLGKKRSEVSKINSSNGQQKYVYTLISPNGEICTTSNLKEWCSIMNMPYSSFSEISRIGGSTKNEWKVFRKRKAV